MTFKMTPQVRLGFFVFATLLVLAYVTLRVSSTSLSPGGSYTLYLNVNEATGITKKTPVLVSGIQVGWVSDISLSNTNQAQLELKIKNSVKISKNVEARIKTIGFLGDTYVELFQRGAVAQGDELKEDSLIATASNSGDMNSIMGQVGAVAEDVKAITAVLREITVKNQQNLNSIIENMKALAENMNLMVARNMSNVDGTLDNLNVVTAKMRNGEGTVGKLLNDDETANKINESLDNLNGLLGGANKLRVDLGYHTEYLGNTAQFKNYVSLALKPKPDKYFLFEFVDDPAPDSKHSTVTSTITSGGTTSVVTEEKEKVDNDSFLVSAQLAKKFYDFTLRGGLIESSGGVGVDYDYGPVGMKFSAFDLETKHGEKPHLKAMGTVNVTKSVYLLGGMDDFLNKKQDPDWFMGAGVNITDDDIKSLFGLMSLKGN
ncbi:MlaD family protein [bacterium]|nr:MlaD family protein [bacterium]